MNQVPKDFNEVVLVVDDESSLRELYQEILQAVGFNVIAAANGQSALSEIEKNKPFLIISDFRMPGLDGVQLCDTIRKNGSMSTFVLLTAFADKQTAMEGLNAGLDEILEKPIDAKSFKAVALKHAEKRIAQLEEEKRETEEITDLFVEESRDLLSDLDQLILRLEQESLDMVVVDLLFRKVHSVKGGGGAIPRGEHLAEVAHHFESVLSKVKKDKWQPGAKALDVFLEAADLCRGHLDLVALRSSPDQAMIDRSRACINALEAILSGKDVAPAPAVASGGPSAAAAPSSPSKSAAKPAGDAVGEDDEGVFVASDKLDSFMKVSGEMIVLKNTFAMAIRDPEARTNEEKFEKRLSDFLYAFNKITDNLQEQIMSVRKVTLERALSKLPRLVRQTAQDIDKKVLFKTTGFDLGVDKTIAKALSASLTHMVRNSIDHGIETPAIRSERGKPPQGTLTITARESQGLIQILIEDDGAGIDRARVVKKALEKSLIDDLKASTLTDSEAFELIFLPGFSTAEKVSAVSGRGVGMDVVRTAIVALNGRISIESKLGEGTRFMLDIPVPKTVMVEQTVIASSRGTMLAIPLQSISRIVPSNEIKAVRLNDTLAFQHDGKTVRLIDHHSLIPGRAGLKSTVDLEKVMEGSVIVLRNKSHVVGLCVEAIYDQLEAVVRPFDSIIQQIPGFRGTTVLGDDRIAYVVSPTEVISISLGVSEEAA